MESKDTESAEKAKKSKKVAKPKAEKKAAEPKQFAIIATGGKQYRVSPGDKLDVAILGQEKGASVAFDDVLMVGVTGGTDLKIKAGKTALGVSVKATVLEDKRLKKVLTYKKRRRGGYTKKQGHRQDVTSVRIDSISM